MNAARIGAGLTAKPWLLLEFRVAHIEFVHTLGKKWSFLLPRAAVERLFPLLPTCAHRTLNLAVCCQRQEEPKGEPM